MGRFDNVVLGLVDHGFFAARIPAPEDKNEVWAGFVQVFYDMLSKSFPSFATVTTGDMCFDGQSVIE